MSIERVEHPYCIIPVDDPVHPIEVNESYLELFGYTMDDYKSGKLKLKHAGIFRKTDVYDSCCS